MSPYSDSYTRLAQAAVSPPESSYPVAPPLYQTASFATDEASVFLDMATRPLHSGFYTRYGNPTTRAFESAVADLEGGSQAFAFASGLAGFRRGGPSIPGEGPVGRSDTTVEQIVYDLVRPMIREWLDDNLPTMVERLVKREIERVVRRGLD